MGCFCRQCPAKQGQQAVPIQTNTNPPKHFVPDARKGIFGQKTADLNFIRMGLRSPPKYRKVIYPSFRETGSRGSPSPGQQ